jgi:hypothetical protein
MATKQQIAKIAATIVEFQEEFSSLATVDGQWIVQHGKEAVSLFVKTVASRTELVKESLSILKLISAGEKIMIESSDGKALISKAKNTFKSWIDPDFANWKLNETGAATPETLLDVYEMANNATFVQMFSELNSDLDKLVMTQAQIIRFCEKHPTWLRQEGNATFFLTKVNGEYFVVFVYVRAGGLRVGVRRLGGGHVWGASRLRRVVAPQLELKTDLIDCDTQPFTPKGWKVEEHITCGKLKFNPTEIPLYLSEKQKKGFITGNDLKNELSGRLVMNANVLDYLLVHPELIPEDWKGKSVFFWGTIYRDSDEDLLVRYLCWDGFKWYWDRNWLGGNLDSNTPAALAI